MKNEMNFISNYQRDFDAVVKPEEKTIPQFATNVPKMPSIEERLCELSERINLLARRDKRRATVFLPPLAKKAVLW